MNLQDLEEGGGEGEGETREPKEKTKRSSIKNLDVQNVRVRLGISIYTQISVRRRKYFDHKIKEDLGFCFIPICGVHLL